MATDKAIQMHYKEQLKARMDANLWPPIPVVQSNELKQLLINL